MPKFVITAPDGADYEVTAPEGATEQEALAHFQSNWKPSAAPEREDANYSNEGRSRPRAQKTDTANRVLMKALLGEGLGGVGADISAGLGKTVSSAARLGEDLVRGRSPFSDQPAIEDLLAGKDKKGYVSQPLTDYATEAYKEAGPLATVANVAGDIALTAKPSAAMADLGGAAASKLPRVLKNAISGATGGATGAALLAPGEDETRLQNAMQGAGFGAVGGAVAGEIPGAVRAAKDFVGAGGPDAALSRASRYFKKSLGPGVMDSVSNNLDLPRTLPMSTAAATGSDELGSLERISRGVADPRANSRWARLDQRTNRVANEAMNEATSAGDDLLRLEPQVREALRPAQQQLNSIRVSPDERRAFSRELMQIADEPLFRLSPARQDLTRLAAQAMSPRANLGELAEFQTSLGANSRMTGPQKARLIEVIDRTIAQKDGGAWRAALANREQLATELDQAAASNAIRNKFTGEYGEVVGKPTAGLPTVTGDKLEGAMRTQGTDRADKIYPVDRLTANNRDALTELVGELRRAESPRAGKGGTISKDTPWGNVISDARGNPIPGANYWLYDLLRKGVQRAGIKGGEVTKKAADSALRNPRVWERMLEADKKVTASDAKMMADILRGTSATAGAASTDKGD